MRVVVALGGNAMTAPDGSATPQAQRAAIESAADALADLVAAGHELVITHGNGPQVGNLLIQQELSRQDVSALPLDVLVAMTEGSLGYILQQALLNELRKRQMKRYVVTVVTQVVVDENDPAFQDPTKPIGPFLPREEAERRRDALGWKVKEDAGRGWRRLVPSPQPLRVIQRHMIRDAVRQGHIVIACGGGGIPVKKQADGQFAGLEAVIDKDLTSSVLAADVGAALLVILTAVPQVYVQYGGPEQRALGAVTLEEIERLHAQGHFPPGSMGPKIEAVIRFLKAGGRRALITNPESLPLAMEGRAGTHFVGGI